MSLAKRGSGAGRESIGPLYQRLPHGPHSLEQREVIRHQRVRMHGAMIEAVAANGYERTSVKQVVSLAGVSRRSFYEQFANKQECFLATFDLLATRGARRISAAYRATEGPMEERLKGAFGELADAVGTNWKGAGLVILEAPRTGAPGLLRIRQATATFEQMLSSSFESEPQASALPRPVVRGIAGGLHGALSMCLREGSAEDLPALTEEMHRWTLLFQTPAAERMAERVRQRVRAGLNGPIGRNGHGSGGAGARSPDERERLLHSILALATVEDFRELSAPQIADAADVPVDAFLEFFEDKNECFLAAFEMLADELLGLAADPDLVSSDWPGAVRRVIGELMRHLAARPIHARTIATVSLAAGPEAIERNLELSYSVASLLTEGAPEQARSKLALEGVVGAIFHTIRCHVAGGQIQLLPALSDYLAYVVLTPFIGADAAAAYLADEQP
jgi:TetR/AcrR family transcriptional regulator